MLTAQVIPVALIAKERAAIYKRQGSILKGKLLVKNNNIQTEWQLSWENKTRGSETSVAEPDEID